VEAPPPDDLPRRRRRRGLRIVAALAVGLALVVVGVWLARVPVATRFVDRELARRGVPARYQVTSLGARGQRLEGVVIGDPARPDLVADWVETRTGIGLHGPYLVGVRAGHVRIRARLVNGRVSLGSIDRLLPPPSGKPFALPQLRVASDDVRLRLETPAGVVGLKLAGAGRLDDGFRGTLAAVAPRLALGGCVASGARAAVALRVVKAAPSVAGPVQASALTCGEARATGARADLDLGFAAALDAVGGKVRLATGAAAAAGGQVAALSGTLALALRPIAAPAGDLDLVATGLRLAAGSVRAVRVRAPFAVADGGVGIGVGSPAALAVEGAAVAPALLDRWLAAPALAATPLAPLATRAVSAAEAAAQDFDATTTFAWRSARGRQALRLRSPTLRARNGASARAESLMVWQSGVALRLIGPSRIAIGGGGLPAIRAEVADHRAGPWRARIVAQPYAAGDSRLAVTPASLVVDGARWRLVTTAILSGPIAGGRVDALALPIRIAGGPGRIMVDPVCTPVSAERLALSGLVLDRPRLILCPRDGVLLRVAGGRVEGAARLAATRLAGRFGSSPLTIAAQGAELDLATRGFRIAGLAATLGAGETPTRLDLGTLEGRIAAGGITGRFAQAGGRIGAVPLQLGDAAGEWRLAGGVLDLTGALGVSDTATPARFQPMRGTGVRLRLANGAVTATGTLVEPTTATPVARVAIAHRLATGTGSADLAVPGLVFAPGFQPDLLTRVTFGVIADVKGTVTGQGRIAWGPAGVTSTGRFATAGTDLAAAFGPVQGIVGAIDFDDLLSLRSAPNQRITVRSINPGIEVTDGIVRFRTLSGTQVQVDNGHWPFAGGGLTLAPTTLDFGQEAARRMTFTVTRAAADKFLQQFDFGNLQATGTFDGELPMVFDATGGRIEGGRLQVRPGGGSIAYLGDLTQKDLGFWGNLAFKSLRSLRYRDLSVSMNGPLSGEMVTEVRFAGVSQGEGAKSNFLIRRLQRLPLQFNIRISAPFRGLLDSARGFYDPNLLIRRNLPALLEEQRRRTQPVQPPASEPVR